ncbi:MAG TPA: ABC transporter permease [Salinimicrobium sp.]|nr:ABC transporter permease [Salinimicrobium sp.]
MIKNYFKITFRNLWKNKGYSFLNIFGLAIGIACASLIFLWVEDEVNYNDYFSNKDNLYKIKNHQTYDGNTFTFGATPGPLAAGIKTEIPGIKNTARATFGNKILFSLGDKNLYEQGNYVDPEFLSMFQLEFIKGDPATAFSQLHSIIISKEMANRFFGSTDVVGKTLKVENKQDYVVTGVFQDLPENVSFDFDWLAPFKIYENQNSWLQTWNNNGVATYVELQPKANMAAINKKLYNYIGSKIESSTSKLAIYPMNRWRMYDTFENGKEVPGRIKYVKLFSIIAWIILIIACINFMNLATARSEKRAREVGVRKVLGAGKKNLISQFLGESVIMALLSALVAVLIVYLTLPAFNSLVEKHLTIQLFEPLHIGSLIAIALVCGLIAGSFPAYYLSSFNPAKVLKGLKMKSGGANFIRKGLVVAQFSVSVILIISTIFIYQQVQHVKNRDLGYNKQNLVYMSLKGNMKADFNLIKNDLLRTGIVQNATLSRSTPLVLGSNTSGIDWEGKSPNQEVLITTEYVSPEYISTMEMQLKEGRDFYKNVQADISSIIINEALAKIIDKKNIIGTMISANGSEYTIVGVLQDFIYNNIYETADPLILFLNPEYTGFLTVRFKPEADLATAIPLLKRVIQKHNPGFPFEYKFIDEEFQQIFTTETLIGKLASVFATLAIFISCLGLFGLAAYTAEQRTKEIGIRKVLGASVKGLAGLLSKDFLKLVGISCIIAFPVAWWVMNNWLQGFAYRINMSWWVFVLAGLSAMLIALLTVSFQAIKAAIVNPVKSLKTE